MYSIAKCKTRSFLLLMPALLIAGCGLLNPKPTPPSDDVVKARQEIVQNKEHTRLWVLRIKRRYEGNETARDYIKARDLYDVAMAQNNSWVTSLKLGIVNNEDLKNSQAFKDKARSAGEATEAFIQFGHSATEMMVEKSRNPVSEIIIGLLVRNGITIWKAIRAERRATRVAEAERTEKELKWSRWEDIE